MNNLAIFIAAAVIMVPVPALGHDFSCRNEAAEIRCDDGKCTVATESFTPMQLTHSGETVELCAYSGCWQGVVEFKRTRAGVTFLQSRVRTTDPTASKELSLLSVMHNRASGAAQISWEGFSSVLQCHTSPNG